MHFPILHKHIKKGTNKTFPGERVGAFTLIADNADVADKIMSQVKRSKK